MKKFIILTLCLILGISTFLMIGCTDKSDDQSEKQNNDITLTLENYTYYLTILSQFVSSSNVAGSGIACYSVYISGAINGLYKNCRLYLESGNIVELNAAGCAQTDRTIYKGTDSFKIINVEGTITPYI